jgi:hypothetical protein
LLTLTKQSWKKRRSVPGATAKLCWTCCEITDRTVDSALGQLLP